MTSCVEFAEPLDQTRGRLEQKVGAKCEYANDVRFRAIGFLYRCGPNSDQFFFRSRADCESFKRTANAGKHADAADYVPPGVKNRDGWIVAYDACMEHGASAANIAQFGLQGIADYCLCTSTKLAAYPDNQMTSTLAVRAMEACSGKKIPPDLHEFIAGGIDRLMSKKSGKKMKTAAVATKAAHTGGPAPVVSAPPSAEPPGSDPTPERKIRKDDSYADVMARLAGLPAEKKPHGDFLDVTYKQPSLLAYPDAGGTCVLKFTKARLTYCEGCSPDRFDCAQW